MRTGTELTDSDFVSFELVDENNMLTNAGVLLADESPMRHSRLFCTRWYGLDKASGIMEALDDKEYSGSLVSLLQNGTEFVKNNTKKRWKKTGNGRVEMSEYPEQAVHEVIVNALIHRDYMEFQENQGRLPPCGQLPSRSWADVQINTYIIFCHALQSEL